MSGRVQAALGTGLVLTVAAAVYPFADRDLLAGHIRAGYPAYTGAQVDQAVSTSLVLLAVVGALGVLGWLATIGVVRAGKRWAPPAASVLLVLGAGVALTVLLVRDTSGDTGFPAVLGWAGLAPCVAGVVAVGLMWTRRPAR
ncbi:hypothetical protein M8542_09110 [Amycolatopsis sp. OK19-0408]|uniref:Uncharacterized protein n=1 Tax=Amycolatopsis iheyensis TaxID=2945988 RepID=A0A9X2SII7_9PSEU|nr:hypothetical protein [Amycolatopsis iheyensis]MCR6482978.1 hypothetical protein [Amycolatopsis iheyensis]